MKWACLVGKYMNSKRQLSNIKQCICICKDRPPPYSGILRSIFAASYSLLTPLLLGCTSHITDLPSSKTKYESQMVWNKRTPPEKCSFCSVSVGGVEYVRFLPPCGILARENKKREKATRLPIVWGGGWCKTSSTSFYMFYCFSFSRSSFSST